jgi:predicted aspartyl protease
MPVVKGYVNDKEVSVLRDTGCSSAVVKTDWLNQSNLPVNNKLAF